MVWHYHVLAEVSSMCGLRQLGHCPPIGPHIEGPIDRGVCGQEVHSSSGSLHVVRKVQHA